MPSRRLGGARDGDLALAGTAAPEAPPVSDLVEVPVAGSEDGLENLSDVLLLVLAW